VVDTSRWICKIKSKKEIKMSLDILFRIEAR